jgi:hypothetical protein
MKITPYNEQPLYRYIANHARCAVLRLWAFYADQPDTCNSSYQMAPYNLTTFSIQFWRWEYPSTHAVKNGTAPFAHVNKVVFDSMRQGYQLAVRARHGCNTVKTYYSSVMIDKDRPMTSYFPAKQDVPGQPFILPDTSYDATGRPFEWPAL